MKFSMFEIGLNKDRYCKRAGESIDTYAAENDVYINVTEDLVKEVAKVHMMCDIFKGALTVGGAIASAALSFVARDYCIATFAKKLIGKVFGAIAFASTELLGGLALVRSRNDIEELRERKINKILSEVAGPKLVVDVIEPEDAEKIEKPDISIVSDSETDDEDSNGSFFDRFSSKVIAGGIVTYIVLGLLNWTLEIIRGYMSFFNCRVKVGDVVRF